MCPLVHSLVVPPQVAPRAASQLADRVLRRGRRRDADRHRPPRGTERRSPMIAASSAANRSAWTSASSRRLVELPGAAPRTDRRPTRRDTELHVATTAQLLHDSSRVAIRRWSRTRSGLRSALIASWPRSTDRPRMRVPFRLLGCIFESVTSAARPALRPAIALPASASRPSSTRSPASSRQRRQLAPVGVGPRGDRPRRSSVRQRQSPPRRAAPRPPVGTTGTALPRSS